MKKKRMKTKIVFGSLLAVFLLVILPSVPAVEFNIAIETNKSQFLKYIRNMDFDKLDKDNINTVVLLPHQRISDKQITLVNMKNTKSNVKKFGNDNYPIQEDALKVYNIFLTKYYKHIKSVNELSTIYYDNDIFNNHKNIFDTYRKNKF